eukprot:scaffold94859_cov81-Phaeocystis_antarctica.AAC.2
MVMIILAFALGESEGESHTNPTLASASSDSEYKPRRTMSKRLRRGGACRRELSLNMHASKLRQRSGSIVAAKFRSTSICQRECALCTGSRSRTTSRIAGAAMRSCAACVGAM